MTTYAQQIQTILPAGVELYCFDPQGVAWRVQQGAVQPLNPTAVAADRNHFLRFIDDGHFTRYFVGNAATSDENPSNATFKLGVVRAHSAFTPHAHGAEHFVLSAGYASCGLYDAQRGAVAHVRLFPGTLLHIPALMPHSFNNRSRDPLLLAVTNTGMGIDHENYAITAAQAATRAAAGDTTLAYDQLAQALHHLEAAMPQATLHLGLTWRERLARQLRKFCWLLETKE